MKYILKRIGIWIISIIIAVCIVFFIKTFVGIPTTISGTSMFPTLVAGDKLFIGTWSSIFNKTPDRGDVITFEAPNVNKISNANLSNPVAVYDESKILSDKILYYSLGITKTRYIKRVIGIPGDHIEIKDGKVYVNESPIDEDYVSKAIKTDMSHGGEFSDVVVPDGYVYVLGDNRISSSDSRRFGCIPIDKIEGKAWFRFWPIQKFGKV